MTEKQKNDVLYVCSLIETIARKTKNHRQDVIRHFTKADIERQLRLAEVNHCLSFEQVSDELIEDLNIPDGDFDTAAECRYTVPSATSIGMLYQGLVLSTMKDDDAAQAILDVFSSFMAITLTSKFPLLVIRFFLNANRPLIHSQVMKS